MTSPLSQRPRHAALIMEALREAWAQKVPSVLVCLVVAATCATALMTLGQGVAQQRDMANALESAGARLLTVTDLKSRDIIDDSAMALIRSMTGVESAVALSTPIDVVNTAIPGTQRTPAWEVDRPDLITTVTLGSQDQPGQASAPQSVLDALRMETSSGGLRSVNGLIRYDLTATAIPHPAYTDLAQGIIVRAGPTTHYRQVRIIVTDIGVLPAVQSAVIDLVGGDDPQATSIETPRAIAQASALFSDSVLRSSRTTLLLILTAGAFFSALVTLTDVLLHRRQMGRRRALGITRGGLTLLTTVRMAIPSLCGAILGTVGASVAALLWLDVSIPLDYAGAVSILATAVACAAAIPPATWAARRDPVSVLRTA